LHVGSRSSGRNPDSSCQELLLLLLLQFVPTCQLKDATGYDSIPVLLIYKQFVSASLHSCCCLLQDPCSAGAGTSIRLSCDDSSQNDSDTLHIYCCFAAAALLLLAACLAVPAAAQPQYLLKLTLTAERVGDQAVGTATIVNPTNKPVEVSSAAVCKV
jgi:hypothetical protein